MRNLASIQTVNAIEPIPNADAIEKIRVLGWWVVVKKGEHRPGEQVVYCEIDFVVPERPEFEFLRASSFNRPRSMRRCHVCRPGSASRRSNSAARCRRASAFLCRSCRPVFRPRKERTLPNCSASTNGNRRCRWYGGKVKGGFPGFLPKTDETRVQVLEAVLERHRGKTFYVTEKLDGTSFTAFLRQGQFGICSRNLWMDETDQSTVFARSPASLKLAERLRAARERLGFDLAIQAEVIGPGIQSNKYALPAVALRVFNVLNVDAYRLLDHAVMLEVLGWMELESVPQLGTMVLNHTVDELVAFSEGASVLNPKVQREGMVLRPLVEEHDEDIGGRLSFKVINPKFLLKYDE